MSDPIDSQPVRVARQSGRTTNQMLDAPLGAVYVWCNSRLNYPVGLAKYLDRDDLIIRPLHWLWMPSLAGQVNFKDLVLDHACQLESCHSDAIYYLTVNCGVKIVK